MVLYWFTNYLVAVKLDVCNSEMRYYDFGLPQGCDLRPTLFFIYINDLFNLGIGQIRVVTFADVTTFIIKKSWTIVKAYAEKVM